MLKHNERNLDAARQGFLSLRFAFACKSQIKFSPTFFFGVIFPVVCHLFAFDSWQMKEMQISMQHIYIELVWANQKRIQGCLQSNTVGKYVRRSAETPVVDYIRLHTMHFCCKRSATLWNRKLCAKWKFARRHSQGAVKKKYMPKWIIRKISWI